MNVSHTVQNEPNDDEDEKDKQIQESWLLPVDTVIRFVCRRCVPVLVFKTRMQLLAHVERHRVQDDLNAAMRHQLEIEEKNTNYDDCKHCGCS